MRTWFTGCTVFFALWWAGASPPAAAQDNGPSYKLRWFRAPQNLLVARQADEVVALIGRAGRSGYNGVVLADYKFTRLGQMPPSYFRNVARVRQAAAQAGLEVIPTLFPMGYSNGLLALDPNLAEGVPVKRAPYVVQGGQAVLRPGSEPRLANAGLEQAAGNRFAGFYLQDDPGRTSFADREVAHGGNVSCRMQDIEKHNPNRMCRLAQRVPVRPWTGYRFSCWVKTSGLNPTGGFALIAFGTGKDHRRLTFRHFNLKATQDWAPVEVAFNSLGESTVELFVGQYGHRSGTLWVDDLALDELSLVNVLRRQGCPLAVTNEDGSVVYVEGKDYQPVRDPKLGQDPTRGPEPWPGYYEFGHAGAPLRLTMPSRIREGQKLRVSWYHPLITQDDQVMCCLTDAKVYALLRDQARRVNALFHPTTFFMGHDEIRVVNWCQECQAGRKTAGELLAANARKCVAILKEVNPAARVAVWSDMFDPYHNAVDHYYLVNGSLKGSWTGLPKNVIIANWNSDKARSSLKFFADQGHPQVIAGYYDTDLNNLTRWDVARAGLPGILGFMYTSFQNRYALLEDYGRALAGRK
jgi:hypothetical protein